MAGNKRPSFLKRQKEQARLARATEKRDARRVKKHSRGMVIGELEPLDSPDSPDSPDSHDSPDSPDSPNSPDSSVEVTEESGETAR
jgi:hypothetical protein